MVTWVTNPLHTEPVIMFAGQDEPRSKNVPPAVHTDLNKVKSQCCAIKYPTDHGTKTVDLFQFRNKDLLIAFDYHSEFYEVISMQTTRASAVIDRQGIPHTVVSDNGPQFACDEFKTFAAA